MVGRCGCASDQCSCHIMQGDGISVTGTGTRSNPYVVTNTAPETGGGGGGGGGVARLTGEIIAYGGQSAPSGWLMCDGATVSRSEFAGLFAVIGTAYGAGDGVTTFRLPDLRTRVPLGADAERARGTTGGTESNTLGTEHLPSHNHSMAHTHSIAHDHGAVTTSSNGNHDHAVLRSDGTGTGTNGALARGSATNQTSSNSSVTNEGAHTHTVDLPNFTGNSGGSSAANTGNTGSATPTALDNLPPFQTVNFIIKV